MAVETWARIPAATIVLFNQLNVQFEPKEAHHLCKAHLKFKEYLGFHFTVKQKADVILLDPININEVL